MRGGGTGVSSGCFLLRLEMQRKQSMVPQALVQWLIPSKECQYHKPTKSKV